MYSCLVIHIHLFWKIKPTGSITLKTLRRANRVPCTMHIWTIINRSVLNLFLSEKNQIYFFKSKIEKKMKEKDGKFRTKNWTKIQNKKLNQKFKTKSCQIWNQSLKKKMWQKKKKKYVNYFVMADGNKNRRQQQNGGVRTLKTDVPSLFLMKFDSPPT